MEEVSCRKRVRDDWDESELDSPEVKRLRDDLLGNLDDSDLCTASPDLDSFMKTFADEISASPAPAVSATGSGDSQPELGFLLEASDDELGLPPSTTTSSSETWNKELSELDRVSSDSSVELSEPWKFCDEILSFDEFGVAGDGNDLGVNNHGEYVALDGLFDYSDLGFGSHDASVTL
ncbi:uncharacterized protein LOC127806437 [Diospyros lotus]|uniref:uncharacterized protein LOC127806437 n=1 Tax=Diospyros lotus TaxID=55363 RepID=UPI00225B0A9D|nr:uncharacterized protein LOC127806437 [Diospyros lotus]